MKKSKIQKQEGKRKHIYDFEDTIKLMKTINPKLKTKKYSRGDLHAFISIFGEVLSEEVANSNEMVALPFGLGKLQIVSCVQNNAVNVVTQKTFSNIHSLGRVFYLRWTRSTHHENPPKYDSLYKLKTVESIRKKISRHANNGVIYPYPEKLNKDGN